MREHLPIIIFLIPFFSAICMPMVGAKSVRWCRPIALLAVFAMCVPAVVNLVLVLTEGETRYAFGGWPISGSTSSAPLGIEWVNDRLASIMIVALSAIASLCLIYSGPVSPRSLGRQVVLYYTLILMLITSLTGIIFAGDLFNIFVFLELAALSGYALVGVAGDRALIASFRYLILGTLGATFYLLGVVFFYATTGTLNMADLAQQLADKPDLLTNKAVIGGTTFMFIGLGIKMALFPLHGWLPGAYTRAPDAISPMLAALMTKVSLYAWVRIMFWVLGAKAEFGQVHLLTLLGIFGAIAAVVGALLALSQHDVKRMFAYGGISHVGLILIGVSQGNETAFAGSMFYLINDAAMQAGLFFIAGVAIYHHPTRTIENLSSLRNGSPWIIATLIILAMSMIGIPPTGGFFGKWHIILGAIEAQNYWAVAAIIIATILTMAYFQRLFVRIFSEPEMPADAEKVETHFALRFSIAATSIVVIAMGICSDPIIRVFRDVAQSAGLGAN
ncbi:MAG: hydrogenase 4 subunit B [Planctomycetes bacterium]|nr:hydrogenase 4 subunit B [Planctomycetota bacterium]